MFVNVLFQKRNNLSIKIARQPKEICIKENIIHSRFTFNHTLVLKRGFLCIFRSYIELKCEFVSDALFLTTTDAGLKLLVLVITSNHNRNI